MTDSPVLIKGDRVGIIDPTSIWYNETGQVRRVNTLPVATIFDVEITFTAAGGYEISRRSLFHRHQLRRLGPPTGAQEVKHS